ncbi:DoxX family protein [Ursidibacter sp. B-7004-1]
MNQLLDKFNPVVFLFVRIVTGYMFLLHGTAKFFEFPVSMTGGNGSVELFSLFGLAAILEVVGGIFIILGLFTRPTAFLLSGQMAYAYFIVHATAENVLQPMLNKGELAALYSVVFLLFVVTGAGKLSLDQKFFGKN